MADERQDSGTASEQFTVLGKHTSRKDGVARVTGQEQYSVDISLPHMLFGRAVGSPHAHARIKRIDVTRAREMGAVVITAEDVPHVCYNERILTIPSKLHKDHYVLADKVRRMGEAVAAVAAETEELAEQACRAVQVEYEVLPAITDPLEAIGPEAEPIHDSVIWGDQQIKISNNIACERSVDQGDAVGVLAASDVLVGGTFSTPKIYHLQLEPKTAVCRPEPGGGLTVWATTQSI
ncbi:MAG: molybdopterin cofactor-binding domain-containing protein, partial [Actinomycetota bacterium]